MDHDLNLLVRVIPAKFHGDVQSGRRLWQFVVIFLHSLLVPGAPTSTQLRTLPSLYKTGAHAFTWWPEQTITSQLCFCMVQSGYLKLLPSPLVDLCFDSSVSS